MKKYILLLFPVLLAAYGFLYEPVNVKIKNIDIHSEKLAAHQGLKIVHISDLHIRKLTNYEFKVINKINAQQPDIIVITGDFLKNNDIFEAPSTVEFKQTLSAVQKFLAALHAPQGVFLCRGNNDFGNDKEVSNLFLDALTLDGIHVLPNQFFSLNENISIIGVDFPDFPKEIVANFSTRKLGEHHCYTADYSTKNSYSHYAASFLGMNYTFSGRFMQQNPAQSGIGFTFYSQMHKGYDRFYRLRKSAGNGSFLFSHHDAPASEGDIYVDTEIQAKQWYRFKIQVHNQMQANVLRAKIWPENLPEPAGWQADARDKTRSFLNGTVGLWSAGREGNFFDDLTVVNQLGDTLLVEDFQECSNSANPIGWIDFNYDLEAIPVLMQQIPPEQFSILLGHSPDFAKWADKAQVDLFLTGHTHGGQVRLPFLGPVFVKTEIGRDFYQGMHHLQHTIMYVNRGIGTAVLPLRFLCPPEITVIHLAGI